MVNAVLIVIVGILCLIGTVVAVIFSILSFADNKPRKFLWLTAFVVFLLGLIFCIYTFITKVVHKVQHFTETLNEKWTDSVKNYSDSVSYTDQSQLQSNEQIRLLKSYDADSATVPDQFYYYLGFDTYYRFPLKYPYSIHCSLFKENGSLFNELKVTRFDENDNGEIETSVDQIDRLALDKNYLLLDRKVTSTRSADPIHHYLLFSFDTGESEEAITEKELLKLARKKGYKGSNKLITINEYSELFSAKTASFGEQ
jgi:uncharacterized membrane protein